MTTKKKKRTPLQIAKDKAWDKFSIYVRLRDDKTCVTCKKRIWDEEKGEYTIVGFNAGHYRHNVLDFDEVNINCQCVRCNHHLSGNLGEYTMYLVEKYGIDTVNDLRRRAVEASKGEKRTLKDYEEIIKMYTEKIKQLA